MWKYISGVLKVVEEEKKEKKQDEDVFGDMASWLAVTTARS